MNIELISLPVLLLLLIIIIGHIYWRTDNEHKRRYTICQLCTPYSKHHAILSNRASQTRLLKLMLAGLHITFLFLPFVSFSPCWIFNCSFSINSCRTLVPKILLYTPLFFHFKKKFKIEKKIKRKLWKIDIKKVG